MIIISIIANNLYNELNIQVTQSEINDYCRSFESKIASFLEPIKRLSDEEASKLGLKESKA